MNWKKKFQPTVLLLGFIFGGIGTEAIAGTFETISIQQNDRFRHDVIRFVRLAATDSSSAKNAFAKDLDKTWFNAGIQSDSPTLIHWAATVVIYVDGKKVGTGKATATSLSETLNTASHLAGKHLSAKELKRARFEVIFYYPPDYHEYRIISDDDKAYELVGNIVPLRIMDTGLLKKSIQAEKAYLLRMMDAKNHAFFKRYNAALDERPVKLRTIYTASSLYTLLKVKNAFPDPVIEQSIKPIAGFLLMMQEEKGENAGAFHYSYDATTHTRDKRFGAGRFVVGTASKTIFTLLMLYNDTHDAQYLDSAKRAGNWLVKKVDANGFVNPVVEHYQGKLIQKTKQSFLYSGQVLSALSRLYYITGDNTYLVSATRIAKRMLAYIQKNGFFLGDSYRAPNSVSTSWVVMSLVDYSKINPDPVYLEAITHCAQELINRQIHAPWDAFNDGRLMDIITSSGNGWVNEVMTELYPVCEARKMSNCQLYRQFILASSRWLVQNMYTSANSFAIKNPAVAQGGVIRNFSEQSVRTDAVCHSLNSLVGLLNIIQGKNEMIAFLPEAPMDETLGLLEMGSLP